ncbi:MAG: topoisomerase DNA-binding C4 zinc finger domain-containing protein [Clostridia bacterium]|nr:topoisomerase DNA-binding C4 zinc finger domain-containing protein [Clostridia bacterium]
MANHKLIYALKDGKPISVSSVENGLKCGCVCPSCGETLVARKGTKRMHHFAHHSGGSCEYGYETSLHLAAKEILASAKKMMIPSVILEFTSYKHSEVISEAKEIAIDRVELEQNFGGLIPDVVVYAGGKRMFVEIFVTHQIDEEKLERIRDANISTLEINLSKKRDVITAEELEELLLGDSPEKEWKYNAVAQQWLQRFLDASESKKAVNRSLAAWHIDYCPIKARVWRGKPYANVTDDCFSCEYCVDIFYPARVNCTGKKRISKMADFDIPEEQRIRESDEKIAKKKAGKVEAGYCPFCGCILVERPGRNGYFLGCSNYPHCRFTSEGRLK